MQQLTLFDPMPYIDQSKLDYLCCLCVDFLYRACPGRPKGSQRRCYL